MSLWGTEVLSTACWLPLRQGLSKKKRKAGDLERRALPTAKNPKKGLLGKVCEYLSVIPNPQKLPTSQTKSKSTISVSQRESHSCALAKPLEESHC